MKNEELGKAIADLNLQKLTGEQAEILLRCLPTAEEVASLQKHSKELDKLSEGDRFLYFLSTVERCETKLKLLIFMENYRDSIQNLQPQINSILTASGSIRSSVKLKKILEAILAFGNYMNSAKRGGAYGFKLSALDRLMDIRASNSPQTLLHFMADQFTQDFPAYNAFYADLLSIEAASTVSIQTLTTDVQELSNGLKLLEGEMKYFKGNKAIEDVYANASKAIEALQADFKNMSEMFSSLVSYFGEDPKTLESTEFFSYFTRFSKNYQTALKENEALAKQAAKPKPANTGKKVRGSYAAEKGAVDDVINEIRLKGFRR